MTTLKKNCVAGMAAAGLILSGTAPALARSPAALTDRQLDGVTAGAFVVAISDAQAAGVVTITATTANSVVIQEAPLYPGNPGLVASGGAAEGTALGVGTNLTAQDQPAASSGTSVTTSGSAVGNLVINSTFNHTTQGAGGVTFSAGWTFAYGAWVGL